MAVDIAIPATEKNAHIARIRAEGHADYNIHPEQPERPLYHSVVFVEPFGGRNLRAFGFDMYTNEIRRESMDRAINFGVPAMSGMVKLAQETKEDVQHGFIYCLPVYYADRPTNTQEQRRAALRALVVGAFRANDLMRGIFGNSNKDLELEIFDEAISPNSLLYGSRPNDNSTISQFSRTTSIEIGGRIWQLRISANQVYLDSVSFTQSWLVAGAGVMLSFLLSGLMLSMFNTRLNARRSAVTLNSIGDGVVATDAEARVTLLNPLAEKLTGWSQSEAIGLPVDEVIRLIHEETRLPVINPVRDVLTYGAAQSLTNHTVLIARDGSECAIADSCAPVKYLDGQVIGTVLVFRDVTKENAAQQALRESESRLSFALQMTHTAAIELNLVDNTSHRTPEHYVIFGHDPHQPWTYDIFLEHVLPEDRLEIDHLYHEAMSAQVAWSFECRIRRGDGEIRWIWVAGQPQNNAAGQMVRIAAIVQDITTRKEVAAKLDEYRQHLEERAVELAQAKDAAEAANRAKSDFLSSMSHELRSPLNAILGFAQLLESESPPLTPVQMDGINEILRSGWHLLTLINEVLDLAKVESGHAPLSLEPVALAEVLFECQKMIEPHAKQCGIMVTFPLLEKSIYVHADRTRVKQVLINLLSNAIKYNRKHGTVVVTCTESVQGCIRVSINDTGPGLSQELLPQLFQAFNRLGQEAGGEEGTGIGLVVAKKLVELMGGTIGVESTVGVGSVFWFELISVAEPHLAVKEVDAAVLIQPVLKRETQLRTLLYVEDNPSNLKLVKQIIGRYPSMRLLTAVNGFEGIEIALEFHPDVILMDINMPGMNGYEALKILKSSPSTAHIPVLALTANAMPRDIKKGIEAGFFRYITKPIMTNQLMEELNVALEFAEQLTAP